jgi:hypothetical protein
VRTNGFHQTLFGKACPNARFKFWVFWRESTQAMLSSSQLVMVIGPNLTTP